MAQAKPIPISATTLAAFKAIAEVRAWAQPSQRIAHEPEAFLRCMDQPFLLTLIGLPEAPICRLLYREHLIEIGLADCIIEDVDLSVLVRHAESETLVRAILDQASGWAFRRRLADPSQQTSRSSQAAFPPAVAHLDRSANVQCLDNEAFGHPSHVGHPTVSTQVTEYAAALGQAIPLHNGGRALHAVRQSESVIDLRSDTSSPGHPAVGRPAFDRLPHTRANGLRRFPREVARWHASHTDTAIATGAAPTGGYRPRETDSLVRSLTVPHILAGAGGDVVRYLAELPEFGESEPLLLAAAAIARSRLDVAESAIHQAEAEEALPQPAQPTECCSMSLC